MVRAPIVTLLSLVLVACGGGAAAPTPTPRPSATPQPTTLAAALEAARLEEGVPGVAAAILQDGRVVFEGAAGHAVLPDRLTRPSTLYCLASVSKMATAALVLRLVEERRASLDDPLSRYVPYLPNADRISVRLLLEHRSGLQDYLAVQDVLRKLDDPDHVWTRDEVLRAITRANFEPGARYQYSNTNYVALGAVVEQAARMPVDEAFRRLVLAPLGLRDCHYAFDAAVAPDIAHGYRYEAGRYTDTFPPDGRVPTSIWGPVWTDGGLVCNARDTAGWTDGTLGGRLLRAEALAEMTRFDADGYGLGVALSNGSNGRPVWGHSGSWDGYRTESWYDPERRLTLAVLTNGDGPGDPSSDIWLRLDAAYARGLR